MTKESRGHITSARVTLRDSDTPWPENPTEVCRRFLGAVARTKHPDRRRTSYGLKHLVEQASGGQTYIPERLLVAVARAMGFSVEPTWSSKVGRPERCWHLGIDRRSLRRFVQRHGVQL